MTKIPYTRTSHQMADSPKLLTLAHVIQRTALSRSTIYGLMAKNKFPLPIRVGLRAVRWIEAEVMAFIKSCPRAGSERPETDE